MPDINMQVFEEAKRNQLVTEVDIQTQVALDNYQVQLSDIINPTQSQDNVVIDRFGEFLSHWNESLNFDTWVKINMEVAGKRILMLRGNSSVGNESSIDDVMIFGDEFNGGIGSGWTGQIAAGAGAFTDKAKVGGVHATAADMARITDEQNDAFVLEFDFYSVAPDAYGCSVAVGNTSVNDNTAGFFWQKSPSGEFKYETEMMYDGVMQTWYHVKLETSDKSSQIWSVYDMDGNLLNESHEGTVTRSANYVKFKQNWVTSSAVYEYIDNTFVRKYTADEPNVLISTPKNISTALKSFGRAG